MSPSVVIAGAGPTGLMLAAELGLAGVDTVVVDPLLDPAMQSRAMSLHARTVEVFDLRGLADDFRDMPVWTANHFAFLFLDVSKLDQEYTLVVPQWRTEQALAERVGQLGIEVRRGDRVVDLEQDDDGVTVRVEGPGGGYRIRADYLVGCDGGGSTVRKRAGFDFPGTESTYYGLLGDVEEFEQGIHDKIDAGMYPAGLFGEVPLGPGKLRLMTTEFDRPLPSDDEPITLRDLKDSIRKITGADLKIGRPTWLSRFGNATRQAANYRSGRVLLAGDAAHIHYPIGGQGLNTGVQDAFNLGWKLAAQINGWAPPGLLDTYHTERHPVGRAVCSNTQAQLALLHPMDRVGPLRDLFGQLLQFDDVNRHLVETVTGTGIRYDMDRPGAPAGSHPLLGRRVPDLPLVTVDGPGSVAVAARSGHGLLLDLSGGTAGVPDLSGWAGRVDLVRSGPVDGVEAEVVLVRPDGYVAWAGTGADAHGLETALSAWFGTGTGTLGQPAAPVEPAAAAEPNAGGDGPPELLQRFPHPGRSTAPR